jgi:hypothetical protein
VTPWGLFLLRRTTVHDLCIFEFRTSNVVALNFSTVASAFAFPFPTPFGGIVAAFLAAGSSSTAASAFAFAFPPFGGILLTRVLPRLLRDSQAHWDQ